MAVTAVQTRSASAISGSLSIAITTTAGNLLGITTCQWSGTTAVPTRTGQTISSGVANFAPGASANMRGDYAMNTGGNANAVGVSATGNAGIAACVTEFTGAKTALALGATNHLAAFSAGNTGQPGSITPTAGSGLMTSTLDSTGTGTAAATIDSAFVVDEAGGVGTVWDGANAQSGSAHKNNVAASAVNPIWTYPAADNGVSALIMEFLADAASTVGRLKEPLQNTSGLVLLQARKAALPW